MKKITKLTLTLLILNTLYLIPSNAQVGINSDSSNPDPSAMLDVKSNNRGVLIPRLSSTERQQILSPAEGLMVYDSTAKAFYYFNGMGWLELLSSSVTLLEDADSDTKIQVEESPDEDVIRFDVAGKEAVQIDSTGNVGIGVVPDNQLSVRMGAVYGTATQTVNTDVNTGGLQEIMFASAGQGWQSITATEDGQLDRIFLRGEFSSSSPTDIRIYEGEGTSGTLLHEEFDVVFEEFTEPGPKGDILVTNGDLDVPINAAVQFIQNQQYTIELTEAVGWSIKLSDNYTGGISSRDAGQDFLLQAFTSPPVDTLMFEVRDLLVQVGEYSLPNTDGEAGQILSTNGNGTMDWQDVQNVQDSDQDTKIQVEESADEDMIRFDVAGEEVMLIDNTGKVGIGVRPTNQLAVKMKAIGTNIGEINTGFFLNSFSPSGTNGWQSVTSPTTGKIDTLKFFGNFGASIPKTIRIYEGEGLGGQLLYEDTNANVLSGDDLEVPINNSVTLVKNQKYTIEMSDRGGWSLNAFDTYTNGISDVSNNDYRLRVSILPSLDTLLFAVKQDNLQIGEYQLTNQDGTVDQVLSTDGNGTVTWRSIIDTDNQMLTYDSNDNTLGITDGNTVTLSGLVVDTDDQTLSFDGTNLSITDGNSVDISSVNTDTDDQTLSFDGTNLSIADGNSVDISSVDTDTDDQTLSFNTANNELSISDGNTVDLSGIGSVQSIIADSGNNTKIQVEESTNDNLIRFDVNNTEVAQFTKSVNSDFILRPNSDNIFIGRNVGASTTGSGNVFVGEAAGGGSTSAVANVVIGNQAGSSMTGNDANVFIGSNAGNSNVGDDNVIIGSGAADSNTNGANNVIIGKNTGQASSGSNNVFLGSGVGRFETGSNKLLIDNEDTPTPLVYGEFDNNIVRINGALEVTGASNLVPVGTIIMWIGDENETVPDGWLICDNRLYNTTTYPDLFALLGTNRTPNFLGRFPVGAPRDGIGGATGISVGGTGGEEDKTLSVANLPPHSHDIKFREGSEQGSNNDYSDINAPNNEKTSTGSTELEGDGTSFKIMPPFLGVQFLIKAE